MKNRRFKFYILLNIAGFVLITAVGLFIFNQFRSILLNKDEFSQDIYDEYINNYSMKTLESMTQYIESKYPILQDKERMAAEAGAAEWYWEMADEWYEIANTFHFAYIYFMKKSGGNYLFIMSTSIRRGENVDWIGTPIWMDDDMVPDFYGIAWETKQPANSPEPFSDEWGTCISSARPIVRDGEVIGLLCVDYDISFLDTLVQQELVFQEQKNVMVNRLSVIIVISFLAVFAIMGYMVWLNNSSVLVSVKQKRIDERIKAIIDAMPLCINIWNKNIELIDCNDEALRLFEFSDKKEFFASFKKLSPERQPDGRLSKEKSSFLINEAFECGYCRDEWQHQKLNGEPVPFDITLIRIKLQNEFFVVAYMQDQREVNAAISKMREADERVQIIFNSTPIGCLMYDKNFNFLDCNREVVKMLELPDKQAYFDRFFDLQPEYQPCGRKSAEMMAENERTVIETGYNCFEWMHQTLGGKPIPCEVIQVRVKYKDEYAVAAFIRDLREQKRLLKELHNENEKNKKMAYWYESILDTIPLPLSITDTNMNWTFINKATENYLEVKRKDVIGLPCDNWKADICHTEKCGIYRLKQGLKQTSFTQKGLSFIVDGDILRDLDGEAAGYVEVVQDITQLEQSTKRQAEAEAANQAKSSFLARVSHEIRTPMNAILGITEIQLQKENLQYDIKEAIGIIHNSGYLLLGIINDILDLSKIEAGKLELLLVNYDVASLINDTIHLNVMRFDSKPIEFKVQLAENIPSTLFGDDLRIKQILNNLLSNAFKYTKSGEILFSVAVEAARDSNQNGQNQTVLVFTVKDSGQGMTKEQVDKLFDEYTRFNNEANRTTIGTGLGMTITKFLVQMMNGEISVESEYEKGSSFTVRLPQRVVDDGVLGKEFAENIQKFRVDNISQIVKAPQIVREYMPYGSILIVDDVETNLYVAKGLLIPYGLNIETAVSGFDAIEKIKDNSSYDIIFMDHFMPKMDGIEAVKIIRELGYVKPVIALTANALAGQAEMFMECGFDGFISKPIDIRQLNVTLNKFVRDRYPSDIVEAARQMKTNGVIIPQRLTAELAGIFIRDAEKIITVLEGIHGNNYRRTDDIQTYIISVHAMKSALANIGELELSDLAGKLENAGRDENFELIKNETPVFTDKLRTVIEKIKPKDDENETADISEEDKKYLHEKLSVIQTACETFDKKTVKETLAELKQKSWGRSIKEKLDSISEHLLHSEFDKIAEIADSVI